MQTDGTVTIQMWPGDVGEGRRDLWRVGPGGDYGPPLSFTISPSELLLSQPVRKRLGVGGGLK